MSTKDVRSSAESKPSRTPPSDTARDEVVARLLADWNSGDPDADDADLLLERAYNAGYAARSGENAALVEALEAIMPMAKAYMVYTYTPLLSGKAITQAESALRLARPEVPRG